MRRARRGCGRRGAASEESRAGVARVDEAAGKSRGGRRAARRSTEEARGEVADEREARGLGWRGSVARRPREEAHNEDEGGWRRRAKSARRLAAGVVVDQGWAKKGGRGRREEGLVIFIPRPLGTG
jgi:hypothetical protein